MTFEEWCEATHHNPQDDELRERWETFVWYTEAMPARKDVLYASVSDQHTV